MFDTFKLLISEVYGRLGHLPGEYLSPEDIAAAVEETFALRGLSAQQSPQGRIGKIVPLNANTRDVALSNAPDILLPSWVERKLGTEPNERYEVLPSYGQAYLEAVRNRGEFGCAFWRDDNGWRVTLSYNPTGYVHRLHYYGAPVIMGSLDDEIPLPKHFFFFFADTATKLTIKRVLGRNMALPFDRQLASGQLEMLGAIAAACIAGEDEWKPMFKNELEASKNPAGRQRRPILAPGRGRVRTY